MSTHARKPAAAPETEAGEPGEAVATHDGADANLGAVVGLNIKRLRARRGLSLDALARASGVSRAMLGQIETGRSVPTINVVWKIASAFSVPFATLIATQGAEQIRVFPAAGARALTSASGEFSSRALFPFDGEQRAEFYELRLKAGATEDADAHAPGTMENLVVAKGTPRHRHRRPAQAARPGRRHPLPGRQATRLYQPVRRRHDRISRHDIRQTSRLNSLDSPQFPPWPSPAHRVHKGRIAQRMGAMQLPARHIGYRAALSALVGVLAAAHPAAAEKRFDFLTTPGKLPKDVRPAAYRIDLKMDVDRLSFSGREEVDFTASKPTDTVTLNALGLAFQRVGPQGRGRRAGGRHDRR